MSKVLHFRRELLSPPEVGLVPGIHVRNFVVPYDVAPWLELRDRAMVGQVPKVRAWSHHDFHSEMLNKSWWRTDRSWFAYEGECIVGSVTLALREGENATVPVVHWLLVDPAWRLRGVGRLLISHLERAVWADERREIELETHSDWESAVAFYHSIGYVIVRDRSLR